MSRGQAGIDEPQVLNALQRVNEWCGTAVGAHDMVIVLITVCIDEGVNCGTDIVRLISKLGFNKQYVGMQLKSQIGHRWSRAEDRRYALIE